MFRKTSTHTRPKDHELNPLSNETRAGSATETSTKEKEMSPHPNAALTMIGYPLSGEVPGVERNPREKEAGRKNA